MASVSEGSGGEGKYPWNPNALSRAPPPEPNCPHDSFLPPLESAATRLCPTSRHPSDHRPVWGSVSPRHTLSSLPRRQIEKVDLNDEGFYTCAATSLAGESKRDVALKVLGEDKGAGPWVILRGPLGLPWGGGGGERDLKKQHVLVLLQT